MAGGVDSLDLWFLLIRAHWFNSCKRTPTAVNPERKGRANIWPGAGAGIGVAGEEVQVRFHRGGWCAMAWIQNNWVMSGQVLNPLLIRRERNTLWPWQSFQCCGT